MKKYFSILIVLLTLYSCDNTTKAEEELKPDPFIERDQMIEMLVDLHIVEASLAHHRLKAQETNKTSEIYYEHYYDKYQISKTDFEKNLIYYRSQLEEYNNMYEEVVEKLEKLQTEVNKE